MAVTHPEEGVAVGAAPPLVRGLVAALGAIIALLGLAWAADLYRLAGFNFLAEQFLAAILGLALALVYVAFPPRRGAERRDLPWYDALLALTGLGTGFYVAWAYPDILSDFFNLPLNGLIASWILYLLVVEGLRRSSGWPLVFIVVFFTAYALVGHLVPGALQTREVELNRMIIYLGVDSSGLFGLVLLVGVTVVIPFVFFGNVLSASGGSGFFNDLSLGLMGRLRGGAAKIAILASSLFGSISGIVVSNILATGIITIPLMKRSGFTPAQAAAIEASASNGGQLMPPVMGAVAFLMADFLQIPYAEVAVAALVPSLLYYAALFIQADLEAAKRGIKALSPAEIPRLGPVLLRGWFFALPFVVLVYAIFSLGREAEVAALWASLVTLGIGALIGYAGRRMGVKALWKCIVDTGVSSVDIIMISAAAGFVIGILQLTGLGFALTLLLIDLGAGNVIALLVISAFLCIFLGMGMPTLGVYVLLAVLVVPGLVEVGVPPLAAHMFILYLGMMSMVTPPVAIGAFFAANLAGAPPMRTGFIAMRFSWTAYIVPFLFVFSPALLLQSESWSETALAIGTAVVGIWLVSAGMVGYALRPVSWPARIAFVVAGAGLLIPPEIGTWALWANVAGLVLACATLALEAMRGRRSANASLASGPAAGPAP